MNSLDFEQVVHEQIKRSTDMLIKKAEEYASDTDRLHNFKVAASMQGCTLEQALGGMMAKHTVSIFDMVSSGKHYPLEVWNEKITDHINYLLLLRAIVDDKQSELDEAVDKALADIADNLEEEEPSELPDHTYFRPDPESNLRYNGRLYKRTAPRYGHPKPGVDDIVLPDREAAENVLEALNKLIVTQKQATVYELYELVGVTGTFSDQLWGWNNFMTARVDRVREGYLLNLPKPVPLGNPNLKSEIGAVREEPTVLQQLNYTIDLDKAIQDQTALNDIAAHLSGLSRRYRDTNRGFRKTDINEIYNIVERVRVVDPDTEKDEDDE